MTPVRALVFGDSDSTRAGRTLRALRLLGVEEVACLSSAGRADQDREFGCDAAWWIRAGTWPSGYERFTAPAPSSTGRPLAALGRVVATVAADPADVGAAAAARAWDEALASTGGDFDAWLARGGPLPPVESAYLEAPVARATADLLRRGAEWPRALGEALRATRARVVRLAALDVHLDPRLRIAQVVTSIQQGGAERLAIDLAESLGRHGVAARLFVLDRPSRKPFLVPADTLHLSGAGASWAERTGILRQALSHWGADLVHAHLLSLPDMRALAEGGYPPLVTVHNMRPGWPPELTSLAPGDVTLLVGCARAVEDDLREAGLPAPVRAVWNGIAVDASRRLGSPADPRAETRRALGIGADTLVLLAIANPRPQKRLHLLPAIVSEIRAALREKGSPREVCLLLAGDSAPRSEAGKQAFSELVSEIERTGQQDHVRLLGSVDPVGPLLAACDALVSPSAHEGLSLAHLEALAAGKPVIASGTGGTEEIGRLTGALSFVPLDAGSGEFATALLRAVTDPVPTGPETVARHFTLDRMTEGYARLYPRAAARASGRRGEGLVLVTNNLSTGGAQSSARRLLLGLAEQGIRARAVVLEEQPEHPTPGRRALVAAGLPVLTLNAEARRDPAVATHRILDWLDADPPASVLFWNALATHKVLLADALFDVPVFDVSPGEMYFASLERYFASLRPGVPYLTARDYGSRLAGVIVKYEAERDVAARALGAPVHVVPNGVPLPEPVPALARLPIVLGTAVRIHPHKKIEELLDAFRLVHDGNAEVTLHVAGGPDFGQEAYFEALQRSTSDLPVTWLGETAVEPFLRTLDVFALVAEPAGCPNASLEALAAGLPVVATDVGGMTDQIEDGVSGRLVPRADPAALAAALSDLCAGATLRARLGAAARERATALFSVARMVDDYRRICLPCAPPR